MNLILFAVLAQEDGAKIREVLQSVGDSVKNAPAVAFECDVVWKMPEGTEKWKLKVWGKRPGLLRIEASGEERDELLVCDGMSCWEYDRKRNTYRCRDNVESILVAGTDLRFLAATLLGIDAGLTFDTAWHPERRITAKKETLGGAECDVIGWEEDTEVVRLWIDAKHAPRRLEQRSTFEGQTAVQTIEFGEMDRKPKISDDCFMFTPPKGATKK